MSKYVSKEFIEKLGDKIKKDYPDCPICGGGQFSSTNDFADIVVGNDFSKYNLGRRIPAGMVICKNCGHIDFFALGALDLIKGEAPDDKTNASN